MTGEDHMIERLMGPRGAVHDALVTVAHHVVHAGACMDRHRTAAQGALESADVFHAAAIHGPPLVLSAGAEKRVVAEDLDERARREGADLFGRRRPDRARERRERIVLEPRSEAHRIPQLADGGTVIAGQGLGLGVEAQNVAHHPREAGAEQIAFLCSEGRECAQSVFDPAPVDRRAEAHVASGDRDVEIAEQFRQVRIVGVGEYDEAGVDRLIAVDPGCHRARVTAKPRRRLEQANCVVRREQAGGREARNAATDDGNALGAGVDGQIE